jgi:hypothetical protein
MYKLTETEADEIVINQAAYEIQRAMQQFETDPGPGVVVRLSGFIAEWLAERRFIRSSAEINEAERRANEG